MRDLVVIGGSAGGIEALTTIVKTLPRNLESAVLVVVHVPPRFPSRLPEILARTTALDCAHAIDGEKITKGTIRIAPPDHHLVVNDKQLQISRTPRENRHRPSIDVLFRSAAAWYGDRVVAVVLSGGPGDGAAGVRAVSQAGGLVLVQDPTDALIPALPESAIQVVKPTLVAAADALGVMLSERRAPHMTERDAVPSEVIESMSVEDPGREENWRPSTYACPDCTGVLWELDEGALFRYRCRIGHAFGSDALVDSKGDELEIALWSAINTMEERGELALRLAHRATENGQVEMSSRYARTGDDMRHQADQVRELLSSWAGEPLQGVPSLEAVRSS